MPQVSISHCRMVIVRKGWEISVKLGPQWLVEQGALGNTEAHFYKHRCSTVAVML